MKQLFTVEVDSGACLNETHVENAVGQYIEDRLGVNLYGVTAHEVRDDDRRSRSRYGR